MSKKLVTVVVSREELVARQKRDGRNLYEPSAKRKLVEACLEPGVSISGMALAHGLNTNVLRKWLTRARALRAVGGDSKLERHAQSAPKLLPVTVLLEPTIAAQAANAAKASSTLGNHAGRINIEIGGARIVVDASVNAAALTTVLDCVRRAEAIQR
jgi:transposase